MLKALSVIRNVPLMTRVLIANPHLLFVKPSINAFMCAYMSKFRVRTVGNNLIVHSHLPPLNSKAYSRFVDRHLIAMTPGPSHAQIGVTNQCPQNCDYCYNKNREGKAMDTETIIRVARELKEMGVVWLGLTGGEPLLNKDLVRIVESVSQDCAVKLFTTGCTLTPRLAVDLKSAGLFSVSVSLDHWDEMTHDSRRRYKGAFREALKAIDTFRNLGGIDVGVSAVITPEMIRSDQTEEFLRFLRRLGIHEAWLSEVKPTTEAFWDDRLVITEEDRLKMVRLQDRWNSDWGMTVNYLGHFEGKECFGCNAGNKMVYVDTFGEVSPCVFVPMSFGNVHERSVSSIFAEMTGSFPSDSKCFVNKNYRVFQKYADGRKLFERASSLDIMNEVDFGERSAFFKKYYGARIRGVREGVSTIRGGIGEPA
jgi:MoaA/NifB/PqqE/SkfB family radical SAM enzyme